MGDRPGAARMFAPAIGVDEDVANANSTARRGPAGITTRVGGLAVVRAVPAVTPLDITPAACFRR
ncbi:hypothetical protein [Streptomyces aureocirculatus]|uniref:hypothetical protein n=1 Tax=Streptomyces aureocirculatus TaxID=67275 RepID=UPI00384BF70E